MSDRVRVNLQAGIADVRLNRPDKMNALDEAMFSALIETGEALGRDPSLRAVVISGEGRAFCAGLDKSIFLAVAKDNSLSQRLFGDNRTASGANHAQQAAMVWRDLPVPVIAAIRGPAFGGGFQVALGCDIRFATPDAQLSVMEIRWGLVPDMAGIALLRRLVRDDVARDLIWTGRQLSGEEAAQIGLVTHLAADPHAAAMAMAQEIANRSPSAIRAGKRLLNMAADASQHELLLRETEEQAALFSGDHLKEAVRANIEGRAPIFTDDVR